MIIYEIYLVSHWGGSNGYKQSMFTSQNKETDVYPTKLHFSQYKQYVLSSSHDVHVY